MLHRIIVILLLQSAFLRVHDEPIHETPTWSEMVESYCIGHGAETPEGMAEIAKYMEDFQNHTTELEALIEKLEADRPLQRMCYYLHHGVLGVKERKKLLDLCYKKAQDRNWNETLYYFTAETSFLTMAQLNASLTSNDPSIVSAAKRAISEKRYSEDVGEPGKPISQSQKDGDSVESRQQERSIVKPLALISGLACFAIISLRLLKYFRQKK